MLPVFFGVTNVTIITVFICIPFLLVWWYVWAFFCCNVCNAMAFLCLFFLPSSNPLRIPFLSPSFLHGLLVEPWREPRGKLGGSVASRYEWFPSAGAGFACKVVAALLRGSEGQPRRGTGFVALTRKVEVGDLN